MNTTYSHLPADKQADLNEIVSRILGASAQLDNPDKNTVEIIIVFGSYARGDFKPEQEIPGAAISDYDIVVVTSTKSARKQLESSLNFSMFAGFDNYVQRVIHSSRYFTTALAQHQYLFNEIVQDGIMLYTTGNITLIPPPPLSAQLLESMMVNPRPTRAEVSDIANAVMDHTDAVMLSGESAFGKYPVESVQMMSEVIITTEQSTFDDLPRHALDIKQPTVQDDISIVVRDLADYDHVNAIVVNSTNGEAARMIARHRPETQVVMLTQDVKTVYHAALTWGVQAMKIPKCTTVDQLITTSVAALKAGKVVKKGDSIILVSDHPVGQDQGMNLIKLHTV